MGVDQLDVSTTVQRKRDSEISRGRRRRRHRTLRGLFLLLAAALLAGCSERTVAPAVEYDQQEVERLRDTIDSYSSEL